MPRRILLFILFGFSVGHIMAQQSLSVNANTPSSTNTGVDKFYYGNRNDPPRAIEFKEKAVSVSYFLTNINRYFNIPAEFTFIEVESNTDHLGMRHRLLQLFYKGILVEGMGYRVHEKDGFITAANGRAVRDLILDTQTTISEETAFQLAINYLHTKDSVFRHGKKLIVSKGFTFAPESFSVAFQFDIDVSLIEQWRISIDARNGRLINKVSLVNSCFKDPLPPLPYGTGTGLTRYYGNKTIQVEKYQNGSSRLVGRTKSGGAIETYDFHHASYLAWAFGLNVPVYDFYSANNIYNSSYQQSAVSVQWAAEHAYDYYLKKHNRNSFDNNGAAIISYVHVDQNFNNAFWSRNKLLFGDGSNNNPLVELDIVSHELTHGVTQFEAGLQYYNESGALNESFSDIFAKAVEFETFGDTATWQLGKYYRDGGLRDMSNPNRRDQPDTYAGDMWYTGFEDNGGVHYNSGVQNFWYYLLCEGGSGVNDHQVSYTVNAIGIDAATKITYRNLTEYLSNSSDYLDSRIGSLLATADLYGKNSAAYQQVDKAWDAVGVIDEPIITSLEVYDITGTTVKLKGSLLPRGNVVTYHFEYGTTPALGSSSTEYSYTNNIEGMLTGLQSETKYYLKLVATNENGNTSYASGFTTISLAPLVKIKQTVDVTTSTAILHGEINPNSLQTSFYFEYGPTDALGLVTPTYPLSNGTEFTDVSAPVANLLPKQTYYYRLVATNSFSSSHTESVSFFTAVKPVISSFTPVTARIDAEVTITGQNFNAVSEKNLIYFGATRAVVLSSSSTQIKVKVPSGASFGPISLVDGQSGLAAESGQEFVPTFEGGFKKGSMHLKVGINDPAIWRPLVHDMDGDNKPDIVTIHYQGFSIFQNVNQGGDITEESFIRNTFPVPDFETSADFQVIDLDGNGLKDVVGRSPNGLWIYPNLSVQGYIFFGTPVHLSFNSYLSQITFGDFDVDGRIDFAGIHSLPGGSGQFTIYRNQNPKGTLAADNFPLQYTKVLPYYIEYLTAADLNNDGKPDLMVGVNYKKFVPILKNNSNPGAFEFEEGIVQDPNRGDRFVRYFSHDVNQDGWRDIIAHSPYLTEDMTIMENKGTSSTISMETPTVVLADKVQSAVKPADINGDGKVDFAVGFYNRELLFLENKIGTGQHLSNSSFVPNEVFGLPVPGTGTADMRMAVGDLNGDGRPDIVNAYSYNYGPHDGYQMEIWQNSSNNNCVDPSLITVSVSNSTATIVLPPNTTVDQFEMVYGSANDTHRWTVSSTTLYNLSPGWSYELKVRAKCYLGFTGYHYINFTTDCVNTNNFSLTGIGVNSITIATYDYSSYEIQYSPAGKDQWETQPRYVNVISNLLPGTTYDIRYRGHCNTPANFKYKQFTTLCPKLSTLTIADIKYNRAMANWKSNYQGNAILEYSPDNVNWTLIDESRTMAQLIPGKQYYVRGKMACTNINSDFINTSFTTPCPTVSLKVENVTPFSARVNWVDESQTGSYTLTYSLTSGGPVKKVETSATYFNLEGLAPGTQYTVSVAPQCLATNDFKSITFSTVCYAPFDLLASDITHTSVELSWRDHFGGLPYAVDYTISGNNVWETNNTPLTNISLTDLRPGTQYEVRVHITCISETAPYVSIRFETSLYEETRLAPNPTADKITIYPSKNLIGNHFIILDNTGRIVTEGALRDYTINLYNFNPGLYTLKIDGETPMKIVKR
ncbi:M4 family metallopeptidase [Chryseolinea sp. H1M3-3]|uniref:M4 family metallopeptidase n=1 Tax=Chryseolinea sp. H1M3-3 TaxID=3034144 RepID=UPI0023EBBB7E|nr:M4 family metallopeptidase [Chryseolinea sp. H1M3-3]